MARPRSSWLRTLIAAVWRANHSTLTDHQPRALRVEVLEDRSLLAVWAIDDYFNVLHDMPYSQISPGVLSNDGGSDPMPLAASLVSGPLHGTLTYFNSFGDFQYVPDAGYTGDDSFTYQMTDGMGTDQATVHLHVYNNVPSVVSDTYSVLHDRALMEITPGVLGNDYDSDCDHLTITLVTGPSHGTLVYLNSNGAFEYHPNAQFVGSDSFVYAVSDGIATIQGTAQINVQNSVPTAANDSYHTTYNTALSVITPGFLTNDYDVDVDSLTVSSIVSGPSHGTLSSWNANGSFTYVPSSGYHGDDSFVYELTDGVSFAQATVFIAVADREHYSLTYSIGNDGNEESEVAAQLVLTLNKPAGTTGVTIAWEPLTLSGDENQPLDWATVADFYNATGTVTFSPGETSKTVSLMPVNDGVVEKNELMRIHIPPVSNNDYAVTTTGTSGLGFWTMAKILDNEWRWETLGWNGGLAPGIVESHSDVITGIANHWFTGYTSDLEGRYTAGKESVDAPTALDGPNAIYVRSSGLFEDHDGWISMTEHTDYEASVKNSFAFDLDPVTGHIGPRQGSVGVSEAANGALKVAVTYSAPLIDNDPATVHTVTMYVGGGAGVDGSWSGSGGYGAYGFSLSFNFSESWSANTGPYNTAVVLRALKGVPNGP